MNVISVVVRLLLLLKDTHGKCNKTGRSAQDQRGQSQNKCYAIDLSNDTAAILN